MKKFRLLVILLGLSNAITYAQSQSNTPKNQVSKTSDWPSLSENGYRIKYPPNWDAKKGGEVGPSFFLFSPLSNESDSFKENVNLLIQDLSAFDITLDKYVEVSEGQIETMITDGKILLSERIKKNETEYQRMIYSGKLGASSLKFEQYYWLIDKQAYVLTLTCKEAEFEAYQETGEAILKSFELNKN